MWGKITYHILDFNDSTQHWSLGKDKLFHPRLFNGCNYLCILELRLIHVRTAGHLGATPILCRLCLLYVRIQPSLRDLIYCQSENKRHLKMLFVECNCLKLWFEKHWLPEGAKGFIRSQISVRIFIYGHVNRFVTTPWNIIRLNRPHREYPSTMQRDCIRYYAKENRKIIVTILYCHVNAQVCLCMWVFVSVRMCAYICAFAHERVSKERHCVLNLCWSHFGWIQHTLNRAIIGADSDY